MAPKTSKPDRTALLVLGMHRSGTSLLSGLIAQAGVDLGRDIMAAAEDNPRGFWENQRIVSLHEKILGNCGQSWSSYQALPQNWQSLPDMDVLRQELRQIIEQEFGDSPLISIKDPRLCRLLPLWRELATELGIALRIVTIVRPAAEVTASLQQRDGMATDHGMALWLRYNLDMMELSEGLPTLRTSYRSALEQPAETLAAISSLCGHELGMDDAGFADSSLQHHQTESVDDWSGQLYRLLAEGDAPLPTIYASSIDPLVMALADRATELAAARIKPEQLSQDALQGARESMLFEQAEEARRYSTAMEIELEERQRYAANLEQELQARDLDITTRQEYLDALSAELKQREEYAVSLEQKLRQLETSQEQADEYAESLKAELATRQDYAQSLEATLQQKDEDIGRREEHTQSLLDEVERLNRELATTTEQLNDLRHRFRHWLRLGNLLKGTPDTNEQ
ncbi:MAG: hypothetical protein ABJ308_16915 [Halieaceae bacterium]